jgi:hypothetical protein
LSRSRRSPRRTSDAASPTRETPLHRAAHAGPIDEDTLVYRIEFHAVSACAPDFRATE